MEVDIICGLWRHVSECQWVKLHWITHKSSPISDCQESGYESTLFFLARMSRTFLHLCSTHAYSGCALLPAITANVTDKRIQYMRRHRCKWTWKRTQKFQCSCFITWHLLIFATQHQIDKMDLWAYNGIPIPENMHLLKQGTGSRSL